MILSPIAALFHFEPPDVDAAEHALVPILECCKVGDFASTRELAPLVLGSADPWRTLVSAQPLLTFATPLPILRELASQLGASGLEDEALDLVCAALAETGLVEMGEHALTIFARLDPVRLAQADRHTHAVGSLPSALSSSFEPPDAHALFAGPEPVFAPHDPLFEDAPAPHRFELHAYVALAWDTLSAHRARYGELALFAGEPIDLQRVSERMLRSPHASPDRERAILESHTGFDLRHCWNAHGAFDRQATAQLLERLREQISSSRFEPGARYFFGRRLPD